MKDSQKAARAILGASLIIAGISHLTFARRAFRAQVPDWVPLKKDDTVVYSGVAELALGSALAFTSKKHIGAVGKVAAAFFCSRFSRQCFAIRQQTKCMRFGHRWQKILAVVFSACIGVLGTKEHQQIASDRFAVQ